MLNIHIGVVYTGYAAGRHHNHGGGGSNHICLPDEAQWKRHTDGSPPAGWLYGVEYRTHSVHDLLFSDSNNAGIDWL